MTDHAIEHTDFPSWRKVAELRLEKLEADGASVRHALLGNGEPGLDEQVRMLTRDIAELKASLQRIEQGWNRAIRVLLLAGISGLGALAWQVILWAVEQGAAG